MSTCIEWAEERIEECNDWRDEGRNECSEWRSECCDWWPCNWLCEIVSWFCVAFVWISNWVCVGWTVVTTAVCVAWDTVTTIVNAILVTLESIFGWVLSAIAFIVELLESIPVLGTMFRWFVNIITHIIAFVVGLGDALLGLIGIRPEKLLRVCTIILSDENGEATASLEFARAMLQLAVDVYKRDANVRIIPLRSFKYSTGFSGAETVDDTWIIVDGRNSDANLLDVPCGGDGAAFEWLLSGSLFQLKSSTLCFFGSWRRVSGFGSPVTCFIIRSIPGDPAKLGCSLWITDYVTIDGEDITPPATPTSPRTLGHELGHACNLWHVCVDNDVRNIMGTKRACDPDSTTSPNRAEPRMSDWQVLLVRASKHVTYF